MFGVPIATKWFVTYEHKRVLYYLAEADDDARHVIWTQQQTKALKFDSAKDAEVVMNLVSSHRKDKKQKFKVK